MIRSQIFFYRCTLAIYLIFSLIFSPAILKASSTYSENADYALIQSAEEAVSSAYDTVLKAENAGANVTVLIIELNEAAIYLSTAENLQRNGDPDGVFELTSRSLEIANNVKDEAATLQTSAIADRDFKSKTSFIGSAVGVSIFIVSMIFFWRWFKGHYVRRVMGLKPEVAVSEA